MPHTPSVRRAGLAALLALLLVGCSQQAGDDQPSNAAPSRSPSPSTQAAAEPTPTPTPTQDPALAWTSFVATAAADAIEVFASPDAAEADRTITAEEVVSLPGEIPLTFLVIENQGEWLQVHLPVRPNGSTGWLRAADVALSSTDLKLEVRLTEHRLLLHKAGEVVMDVPVGVGRDEVPTPGGVYYVKELLQPPDEGSIYGSFAYGLSGYSPVLESFAGGQGVIGIHGTNEPASVGTDASHGCIRMYNEDVTRLVEEFGIPLGTPVEIVA